MYQENGVRCFYRGTHVCVNHMYMYTLHKYTAGLVPSLLYIAPQAGLSFGIYHGLIQLWNYTSSVQV